MPWCLGSAWHTLSADNGQPDWASVFCHSPVRGGANRTSWDKPGGIVPFLAGHCCRASYCKQTGKKLPIAHIERCALARFYSKRSELNKPTARQGPSDIRQPIWVEPGASVWPSAALLSERTELIPFSDADPLGVQTIALAERDDLIFQTRGMLGFFKFLRGRDLQSEWGRQWRVNAFV